MLLIPQKNAWSTAKKGYQLNVLVYILSLIKPKSAGILTAPAFKSSLQFSFNYFWKDIIQVKLSKERNVSWPTFYSWNSKIFCTPYNKITKFPFGEVHFTLDLMPINMISLQDKYCPHSDFSRQNPDDFTACSIVRFRSVYSHMISTTVSSSTMPFGEVPRIPKGSNEMPVSLTVFPVLAMNALLTPHWIGFTLEKSYTPRRRFRSAVVTLLALRNASKIGNNQPPSPCQIPSQWVISLANGYLADA